MADQDQGERNKLPFWAAGTILLLATIILVMVVGAYFEKLWSYEDAQIGVATVAAIATIALALGIYYQGIQNQDILAQNEALVENAGRQTLILQESEWMPDPVFVQDRAKFRFKENRPYYPKAKLKIGGEESSWIPRNVGFKDHRAGHREWNIGVGGVFNEMFALDDGDYTAELCLNLESITGEEYEYRYEVGVSWHDGEPTFNETRSVERIRPWDDVG